MHIFDKLFGKSKSQKNFEVKDNSNSILEIERIRFSQKHPDLSTIDNDNYRKVRLMGEGSKFVKLTLETQCLFLI